MYMYDTNRLGHRKGGVEILIGLCLVLAIFSIYGQVRQHQFIGFDDDIYVASNRHVQDGLTIDNLKWSLGFNNEKRTYWHPITWLSHMLDMHVFGLYAGGHLMTNVVLHILNTLLLFYVLSRWAPNLLPAVVAAAIFAIHPICVESVAWVAARKNLLSSFFWIFTILLYDRYARHPRIAKYLGVLLSFSIGLMAKPMLVTLPFVLLLLDYWPLGRLSFDKTKSESLISPLRLIAEKIPLLLLATLSIILSVSSLQGHHSLMTQDAVPLELRIGNALVSYIVYIGKLLWPNNLSVFYPFPNTIPVWQPVAAFFLLFGITFYFIKYREAKPYLLVGWLWYLGTLVPVIGLVQAGLWPAIADRFAYIPFIGLYIIIAWGFGEATAYWRYRRALFFVFTALVVALTLRAWYQTTYWANSKALFERAIELNDRNIIAHNNIGRSLIKDGQVAAAVKHYSAALSVNPKYVSARKNLGAALAIQGKTGEAIYHLYEAVRLDPLRADAHYNLGNVFSQMDREKEAIHHYSKALEINPGYFEACNNLGNLYAGLDRFEEALRYFNMALKINPRYATAHNNVGTVLVRMNRLPEADQHYRTAIHIRPEYAEAHNNLGVSLKKQGHVFEASVSYRRALELNPKYSEAHFNLGLALASVGQIESAVDHFQKALGIKPDDLRAQQQLVKARAVLNTINKEIDSMNALITNDSSSPVLQVALGDLYKKKGDYQTAVVIYNKALELDRRFVSALHKLGIVYAIKGEFDRSINAFKKVTELDPESAEACYWLAGIFAVKKQTATAIMWLEEAISRGYSDWNRIQNDPKLNNLRDTLQYKRLIKLSSS